jgi:hypothetical protein
MVGFSPSTGLDPFRPGLSRLAYQDLRRGGFSGAWRRGRVQAPPRCRAHVRCAERQLGCPPGGRYLSERVASRSSSRRSRCVLPRIGRVVGRRSRIRTRLPRPIRLRQLGRSDQRPDVGARGGCDLGLSTQEVHLPVTVVTNLSPGAACIRSSGIKIPKVEDPAGVRLPQRTGYSCRKIRGSGIPISSDEPHVG